MTSICDVAIIGAGPYGLSLAAHLNARGIDIRVFGKPLDSWRAHMPRDMYLTSDGFASNLDAPEAGSTLEFYCRQHGLPYEHQGQPVPLDTFNAYATWFQTRFVPNLEETHVVSLEQSPNGFVLTLESGERFEARHVVNAVGISWFAHVAPKLADLPDWAASHSFAHRDVDRFKGREVIVLGAGDSAFDLAAQLKNSGADVRILARAETSHAHDTPVPLGGSGSSWRSFICMNAPLLFHRLPERLRLRTVKEHRGGMTGRVIRKRVDSRIPVLPGREVLHAQTEGDRVALRTLDRLGEQETLTCDHVIGATGYRPALHKLPFLDTALRERIAQVESTPILSDQFESSVPGLYFTGSVAANSFGPLMGVIVGTEFAAPRIAARLARRLRTTRRRAA